VLVIDDEPTIGRVLTGALRTRGYNVQVALTGAGGLELASALEPDVVIVDLGLPDLDGVEVCRQLRRWTPNPIIVLTVDDGENRKVQALDAGADDYVTKPWSMPELLARLRVATRHRRSALVGEGSSLVQVGDLGIDLDAHETRVRGELLRLTPKEYALLALLARSDGRLLQHHTLLAGVWGAGAQGRVEYLRVHVNQLRRKLEAAGAGVEIVTEAGVGYRLVTRSPAGDDG
jgi:two-component system KDP operon response regulator KdpE